jgi:predicted kinase
VLLVVTGLPCSGKTTLARRMSELLSLPLVTKDDIKERLFDTLGWSDRLWSRRLGEATYAILFHFIETLVASGRSLVAESNFPPGWTAERLSLIRKKYPFRLLAVECIARSEILERRWRERAERGTRHPGHNDPAALEEFLQLVREHTGPDDYGRLGIPPGAVFVGEVDTSIEVQDLEPILAIIRKQVDGEESGRHSIE